MVVQREGGRGLGQGGRVKIEMLTEHPQGTLPVWRQGPGQWSMQESPLAGQSWKLQPLE